MRALVMSGGGAYGAYEAGAVQALATAGLDYDMLYGVSVGAINAAWLAQHKTLAEGSIGLLEFWDEITTAKVYRERPGGKAAGLWGISVYDSTPIVQLIQRSLDRDKLRASGKRLRVGAVCWETGEYKVTTEADSRIAWWVAASSSYPVFFLPIKIDGSLWTDGGLRNITPVREAIVAGAKEVDVVVCEDPWRCGGWNPAGEKALPGFMLRAMSVMLKEIAATDLYAVGIRNQIVQLAKEYADVKVRVIYPQTPLAGSSLAFDQAAIQNNIAHGRADAERIVGGG
jgi:NTE family protein